MTTPLTFPRATFAKLSPHPFLLANLRPQNATTPAVRTNGRAPNQARQPHVNSSSLSHAHGSAVVRTGDTTVICGVRGEILPVTSIPNHRALQNSNGEDGPNISSGQDELRDYDLLVPNIELATGCAPSFLPGVPPTPLAQTLSTRVYELLHSCRLLRGEDLRIWREPLSFNGEDQRMAEAGDDEEDAAPEQEASEIVGYWTLYIDLLFVSFDGNPFDAAWAAVVAALCDTKLPKAWWDADGEKVVCSRAETKKLTIMGFPVACSAAVFLEKEHGVAGVGSSEGKHWVLLDPDRLEESLCKEGVTVVVDRSGGQTRIRSLSKPGGTVIGPAEIRDLVKLAEGQWEEFRQAMA